MEFVDCGKAKVSTCANKVSLHKNNNNKGGELLFVLRLYISVAQQQKTGNYKVHDAALISKQMQWSLSTEEKISKRMQWSLSTEKKISKQMQWSLSTEEKQKNPLAA